MRMQRFLCGLSSCFVFVSISAVPVWGQGRPPGSTVRLNDIEMHYQILGSGEPLLLLHGFGGCGDD
jgi:hypothetical protein